MEIKVREDEKKEGAVDSVSKGISNDGLDDGLDHELVGALKMRVQDALENTKDSQKSGRASPSGRPKKPPKHPPLSLISDSPSSDSPSTDPLPSDTPLNIFSAKDPHSIEPLPIEPPLSDPSPNNPSSSEPPSSTPALHAILPTSAPISEQSLVTQTDVEERIVEKPNELGMRLVGTNVADQSGLLDDEQPDVVMYAQYDNNHNNKEIIIDDYGTVTNSNHVDDDKDIIPSPSPSPRWLPSSSSLLLYQLSSLTLPLSLSSEDINSSLDDVSNDPLFPLSLPFPPVLAMPLPVILLSKMVFEEMFLPMISTTTMTLATTI